MVAMSRRHSRSIEFGGTDLGGTVKPLGAQSVQRLNLNTGVEPLDRPSPGSHHLPPHPAIPGAAFAPCSHEHPASAADLLQKS